MSAELTRTNWSMIFDAVTTSPSAEGSLEQIVRRYWPAVYGFIRRSGHDPDEAADLTQGFVCDVLLGRNLLQAADPDRGRFRSLLLRSVSNYLRTQHRDRNRAKRAPAGGVVLPLGDVEKRYVAIGAGRNPEEAFHAQWAATLVEEVLEQVRAQCLEEGYDAHWAIFEGRIIRPMLFGDDPVSYEVLVERWGLRDSAHAANLMVTVKRRCAKAIVQLVTDTVQDPLTTSLEIAELMRYMEPPR